MPDRPWRLTALSPLPAAVWQGLFRDLPVQVTVPDGPGTVSAALAGAELVVGDWTGTLPVDAAAVAAAPLLAFVQQPSVGVEAVDLEACAAAGVPVANVAGSNSVAVAEWCVASALCVLRCLRWADGAVRAGRWPNLELASHGSVELAGRRVGVIGFGPIGAGCARLFGAFGCPVSYWSRTRRPEADTAGAAYRDLDELLSSSDVLVVVVALAPGTRGLLDADRIARLPDGAVLINAARGGIVDEAALAEAVEAGRLSGAAVDVFRVEPLPAGSPLRRSDRILLSPHAAGSTRESLSRVTRLLVDNVGRAVAGQPVRHVRNGVDPVVRRRPAVG